MLLALQLIFARREIWVPERWRELELAGERQQRFIAGLMKFIRTLERFTRPRLRFLFGRRWSNPAFGLFVLVGSIAAFVAPPFTGLDTLPALAVVLVALGVLLEDFAVVAAGALFLLAGITLEAVLGAAAVNEVGRLL